MNTLDEQGTGLTHPTKHHIIYILYQHIYLNKYEREESNNLVRMGRLARSETTAPQKTGCKTTLAKSRRMMAERSSRNQTEEFLGAVPMVNAVEDALVLRLPHI